MVVVLIFLAGIGVGGVGVAALIYLWTSPPHGWPRPLPAATPRAIARVRRRNRADLRHVRPIRGVGVRDIEPGSFDPWGEGSTRP